MNNLLDTEIKSEIDDQVYFCKYRKLYNSKFVMIKKIEDRWMMVGTSYLGDYPEIMFIEDELFNLIFIKTGDVCVDIEQMREDFK